MPFSFIVMIQKKIEGNVVISREERKIHTKRNNGRTKERKEK
jgi:hypothetical protein